MWSFCQGWETQKLPGWKIWLNNINVPKKLQLTQSMETNKFQHFIVMHMYLSSSTFSLVTKFLFYVRFTVTWNIIPGNVILICLELFLRNTFSSLVVQRPKKPTSRSVYLSFYFWLDVSGKLTGSAVRPTDTALFFYEVSCLN